MTHLVRTQADLEQLWSEIIVPGAEPDPVVFVLLIDEASNALPATLAIEDPPEFLSVCEALDFAVALRTTVAEFCPGGSVAVLLSRPGPATITPDDVRRAHELHSALERYGVRSWPFHIAGDREIRPVSADDLTAFVRLDG